MTEIPDNLQTKAEIFDLITQTRTELEATLARVGEAQMMETGVENGWSIKDILAHIAVWEGWMAQWLTEAIRGEIPDQPQTDEEVDRRNAAAYEANRERPLADILAEFHQVHQEALRAIQAVPEADLFEPGRFLWRKGNPLWHMVGGNTFWHYREHIESIENWLGEG
ncbi:MAG: ClbS/DfsB family four-helix bundle protein [Chloroflexi bacterium]|nr:ClbS/DfsB family four-helix bundle protein [Chloroflexota bacterium]